MTLNEMAKAIQIERKCTRRHANRLAIAVIDGLTEMDKDQRKFEREPAGQEWSDHLQGQVLWEE